MEHREWCPTGFSQDGIDGQRVAVAGHSHWSNDPDNDAFTHDCMNRVLDGTYRLSFFTSIARYFGFNDPATFWSRILFFNFLPTKVGLDTERYGYGNPAQLDQGRNRVLRILNQHQPEKLFVFSTKAWTEFLQRLKILTAPNR